MYAFKFLLNYVSFLGYFTVAFGHIMKKRDLELCMSMLLKYRPLKTLMTMTKLVLFSLNTWSLHGELTNKIIFLGLSDL